MFKKEFSFSRKSGFTLIEMLIFLFIFLLITVTFYSVWALGTKHIIFAKNKLVAISLANEKMEIIKNMAFEDIALGSQGNLIENEDVSRSGRSFHVFTQIRNIDDQFDGTLEDGTDSDFVDYKIVLITISWDNGINSLKLVSRFVPAGIEQSTEGLGVLVVNVLSDKAGGALISGSNIHIQNSSGFSETHSTDSYGRLMLVGIPEAIKDYQITVSKTGYETVLTMPAYPDSAYNPTHEHASVVSGSVNTIDIFQNELNNFTLRAVDYLSNDLANISFHLKGGKKMGTDAVDPTISIYNMEEDGETGSGGTKDYGAISPGEYVFTLSETDYTIIGVNTVDSFDETNDDQLTFSLAPGSTSEFKVKVSPDNTTALLAKIRDINNVPIQSASVHLTNGSGYDQTITTEYDGMAFYPNQEDQVFASGTYDISVTAAGFTDYSGQVTVSDGQLKSESISLVAQ